MEIFEALQQEQEQEPHQQDEGLLQKIPQQKPGPETQPQSQSG